VRRHMPLRTQRQLGGRVVQRHKSIPGAVVVCMQLGAVSGVLAHAAPVDGALYVVWVLKAVLAVTAVVGSGCLARFLCAGGWCWPGRWVEGGCHEQEAACPGSWLTAGQDEVVV
jgi:hypothetical protein